VATAPQGAGSLELDVPQCGVAADEAADLDKERITVSEPKKRTGGTIVGHRACHLQVIVRECERPSRPAWAAEHEHEASSRRSHDVAPNVDVADLIAGPLRRDPEVEGSAGGVLLDANITYRLKSGVRLEVEHRACHASDVVTANGHVAPARDGDALAPVSVEMRTNDCDVLAGLTAP
jgi:hypothetical protein